jgi:hypothetical protein
MDCEMSDGADKKLRITLTNIQLSSRLKVVSISFSERTINCPELKEVVKLADTDLLFAKGNHQVKQACIINSGTI